MARSISGVVTLEGQPFVTRVVGVSVEDSPRVLNYTTSNPDGSYFMNVTPWTGEVMVYAVQDYGNAWSANTTLAVGDFIHPSTPNGYIFRVTTAGNTGTEEPTWPAQQATVGDGGVQYEGERLIQPVINGYLSTELDSPSFPPIALFNQGDNQGAWFDPSDIGSLFQDAAMTIPVTQDGDRVGAMVDKSGNGNHALQTDENLRPIYRVDSKGLGFIRFNEGRTNHNRDNSNPAQYLNIGNGATANTGYLVDFVYNAGFEDSSGQTPLFVGIGAVSKWPWYGMTLDGSDQILQTTSGYLNRYSGTPSGHVNRRRALIGWSLRLFMAQVGTRNHATSSSGTHNREMSIGNGSDCSNCGAIETNFYQGIILARNYTDDERSEIGLYMNTFL